MTNLSLASLGDEEPVLLRWRVLAPNQLWQAEREPYLCTVVRSLNGDGYYVAIVRSGDLFVVVLEDAPTLAAAQTWCAEQVRTSEG